MLQVRLLGVCLPGCLLVRPLVACLLVRLLLARLLVVCLLVLCLLLLVLLYLRRVSLLWVRRSGFLPWLLLLWWWWVLRFNELAGYYFQQLDDLEADKAATRCECVIPTVRPVFEVIRVARAIHNPVQCALLLVCICCPFGEGLQRGGVCGFPKWRQVWGWGLGRCLRFR